MSAVDAVFRRLRESGRKALMPFVTAGDPDLEFTEALLRTLVRQGCPICELGIPYSDPVADGPVIQASYCRALERKTTLGAIFDMLGRLTPQLGAEGDISLFVGRKLGQSLGETVAAFPIVTMVSYTIVYRRGLDAYVRAAKAAGVAGAIVPDLPVEESGPLAEICRREDFSLIPLITPITPPDRAERIARQATGFIYYVSVTGITGERTALPPEIVDNVAWLRQRTPLPICVGFGISRPEHVRMLAPVADGLIVGSAIVRRMAAASEKPRAEVLEGIATYVRELINAMEA